MQAAVQRLEAVDGGVRVPWDGAIVAHTERGAVMLRGVHLGRRTVAVRSDEALLAREEVTLELVLSCERVFVVALVQRTASADPTVRSELRFSVTSPRGNDLIAREVRECLLAFGAAPGRASLEPAVDLRGGPRVAA